MARKRVNSDIVDMETGEILEVTGLPRPEDLDKTKPLTDEQYRLISRLPDSEKPAYMNGFKTSLWEQKDIERHYQAAHFPEVKYHSSGGGGKGTVTPPGKR